MNRTEYIEQVIQTLRRTTYRENLAIREELAGHIEDHMEGLLELGWDEALAEERTLAAMGDPAEVARELDRQYPAHWLLLGRVALVLTVLMCLLTLTQSGLLYHPVQSILCRLDPTEHWLVKELPADAVPVDVRVSVGNDIVRVYAVGIYDLGTTWVADLSMCAYDRLPGGIVSKHLLSHVKLENQQGRVEANEAQVFPHTDCIAYTRFSVPVAPGDTHVTLVCDLYDNEVQARIPLPEEVGP